MGRILQGDCLDVLQDEPDDSIDLIITSPPYADRRKNTYGAIHPDKYVEWFLPRAEQFKRVLKPTGTFILNIKENVVAGERHTYVIDLIKAMRGQGWLWTEEYVWYKRNSMPGKWPNRFRDAWERCLQFNKQRDFCMYQDAVMVPIGDWVGARLGKIASKDTNWNGDPLEKPSDADVRRRVSQTKSGFGRNVSNWIGRDMVYPTNVLHLSEKDDPSAVEIRIAELQAEINDLRAGRASCTTVIHLPVEGDNTGHSAAFPVAIPRWFIRLFTKEGDIVLDPFFGSGTTGVAARQIGRAYIGIEMLEDHINISKKRLANVEKDLLDAHEVDNVAISAREDSVIAFFGDDS